MIDKRLIKIDLDIKNKIEILEFATAYLRELDYIDNVEKFILEIKKREEIMPTSVGFGVAIPHCRTKSVKKAFVYFIRSKEAFKWNDDDLDETELIFIIGVPENKEAGTLHLRILSNISKKLMHDDFRSKLKRYSEEEIFTLLNEIDLKIEEDSRL